MALDAQDRTKLTMMRYALGAPKVADLIVDMDKSYGDLPAMKQVNSTFAELASKDTAQLKKLNDMLEKNPDLANKIKDNLGKNPETFRTQFLPAVFKNPENAVALAAQAPAPAPKPAAPAPFQKSYGDYPEPGPVRAAAAAVTATVVAGASAAPAPAQAAGAPATGKAASADERLNAKLEQLGKAEGFNDLMDRVDKNPSLGAAMTAVMASNGSASDREQSVDMLLQKTKDNPLFFKNIVEKIDTFPGQVSGIASQIAANPKDALNKLSELGEDDGGMMGGLNKFLKTLTSGGAGGLGGLLQMFASFLSAITGGYGGSANHLVIGGNSLMDQYEQSLKTAPQNPNRQVAVLPEVGGTRTDQSSTSDQNKAKAPAQNQLA